MRLYVGKVGGQPSDPGGDRITMRSRVFLKKFLPRKLHTVRRPLADDTYSQKVGYDEPPALLRWFLARCYLSCTWRIWPTLLHSTT